MLSCDPAVDANVPKLRAALANNPDFTGRTESDLVGEWRLRRFLIARNNDLDKAKFMYEEQLKWRKENSAEELRAAIIDKPYLVQSLPYAAELRTVNLDLSGVVLNAGFSRGGDAVQVELMAGNKTHLPTHDTERYVDMMYSHFFAQFEARELFLDKLCHEQQRLVRTVQIRDVSKLSFMPGGQVVGILKKIFKTGFENYPEVASFAFMVDAPAIFNAIFAIIRPWLPEDSRKKLHFIAGDAIPETLLKYVHPPAIAALSRVQNGEIDGDSISFDTLADPPLKSWSRTIERTVHARRSQDIYFALSVNGVTKISWKRTEPAEKARVHATILFIPDDQKEIVDPAKLTVHKKVVKDETDSASLPFGVSEAVVVLHLDNSASWMSSHKFHLTVEAS